MNNKMPDKGYSYTLEDEKLQEFAKLTYAQRLEWIAKTHRFLKKFMPEKSKIILQKFRTGEI